jgi:hypothetical protein
MQLSIHLKFRTNEFALYGWHILDDLGCFCTILARCCQMRQLQTAGSVDHEIVSVPIATALVPPPAPPSPPLPTGFLPPATLQRSLGGWGAQGEN